MASRPGGPMRWTARYSLRYRKGDGMVATLPSVSMLVNPTRPGLVHSEYAKLILAETIASITLSVRPDVMLF